MVKDDYPVVVYQILAYLYQCLKKDMVVEEKYLRAQGELFEINDNYWRFIIFNLQNDNYITGSTFTKVWGENLPVISNLENITITPKGIEYLTENSFISKAKEFLKDTKGIIPFV